MEERVQKRLIVGLGNPGETYDQTRHNIGFRVVKRFAQKQAMSFRHITDFIGDVAKGYLHAKTTLLLLPLTYMNSSGEAIRRCMEYFAISLQEMLVVYDDVALPFGRLRLKPQGSSGGHNGLKSIEQHLGSSEYARLRVGIGVGQEEDLAEYVLGKFTSEEREKLPQIVDKATEAVELWLSSAIESAMHIINSAKKEDEIGE